MWSRRVEGSLLVCMIFLAGAMFHAFNGAVVGFEFVAYGLILIAAVAYRLGGGVSGDLL